MIGMSPWLGRLILLLAQITIDHASSALAVTQVTGAAVAATAIFLYRGSYMLSPPWWGNDKIDYCTGWRPNRVVIVLEPPREWHTHLE
jgi:hypothetical protein